MLDAPTSSTLEVKCTEVVLSVFINMRYVVWKRLLSSEQTSTDHALQTTGSH